MHPGGALSLCASLLYASACCACAAPPARRSLLLIRLCLIMAYVWLMTAACNGYPSWPNITDGPAGQPGFISVDGIVWWVGLGWEAAAGARACVPWAGRL